MLSSLGIGDMGGQSPYPQAAPTLGGWGHPWGKKAEVGEAQGCSLSTEGPLTLGQKLGHGLWSEVLTLVIGDSGGVRTLTSLVCLKLLDAWGWSQGCFEPLGWPRSSSLCQGYSEE